MIFFKKEYILQKDTILLTNPILLPQINIERCVFEQHRTHPSPHEVILKKHICCCLAHFPTRNKGSVLNLSVLSFNDATHLEMD